MNQTDRLFMKVIDNRNLPAIINKREVSSVNYGAVSTVDITMATGLVIHTLTNYDEIINQLLELPHS